MTPDKPTTITLRTVEKLLLLVTFVALLTVPWAAGVLGVRPTTVENRALAARPDLSLSGLIDEAFWSEVDEFLTDHTPLRQEAIRVLADLQGLAGVSASTDVFRGNGEVLFLAEEFTEACSHDYEAAELAAVFAKWASVAAANGKTLSYVVAPDKSSVLTDLYGVRERAAAPCAEEARTSVAAAFSAVEPSPFVQLWDPLRTAYAEGTHQLYYTNDSHWTFHGASVFAQTLVERFNPSVQVSRDLIEGAPYTVKGDAARRLGRLETETFPALSSRPQGVTTTLSEQDIDGTRTVRTYTSESTGINLIPGETLVLHDSFMNFAEAEIAPYFESITFIHWHDTAKASFFDRVATADNIILEVVERNMHLRAATTFLGNSFGDSLLKGLSGEGSPIGAATAEDMLPALEERKAALLAFIADTGTRPASFSDLIEDPGVPNWAGPYVTSPADDAVYGEWRTIDGVDRQHDGGLIRCEMPRDDCGLWLLLTDAPGSLVQSLDVLIDGGDGLNSGDVRLSSQHSILYYWVSD